MDRSCAKRIGFTHQGGQEYPTYNKEKADWIGHMAGRNCLLKRVVEGNLEEVTGRRRIRRKQLLDDLKETRRYWKLNEEALHHILRRTRFGTDYRSFIRHPTE